MMTNDYHAFQEIRPTKQHIINCSYAAWYPKYSKITPKSHIIGPLPQSFITYILQDGIKMPAEFYDDESTIADNSDYSDWEEDEKDEKDEKKSKQDKQLSKAERHQRRVANDPTNGFKSVHEQIKNIIRTRGPVVPKLNWSAPKDAAWMLPNHSMKCTSATDVYLILNASSYIIHDLTESLNECIDIDATSDNLAKEHESLSFQLVLKEWFELNPAWEFRCFVKDRKLIAASQRDPNFYDYLQNIEEEIKDKIFGFFEDNLRDTFPDNDFVFDVYLPDKSQKVFLIDINPFARKTDSLLFSWNEVLSIKPNGADDDFELRVVAQYSTARFAAKEHSENHVPKDMVDAAVDTSKMIELMKAYQESTIDDDNDSSTDNED